MNKTISIKSAGYALIAFIIVLPMLVLFPLIGFKAHSVLLESAILKETIYIDGIRDKLNNEILRLTALLENQSSSIVYSLERENNVELLLPLLKAILIPETEIHGLYLVKPNGELFVGMDKSHHDNSLREILPSQIHEHSFNPESPRMVIPLYGRKYIGSPDIHDGNLNFNLSMPIGRRESPVGVLIATIFFEKLWENLDIKSQRLEVLTYFVDRRGGLLTTPPPSSMYGRGDLLTRFQIVRWFLTDKNQIQSEPYEGLIGVPVYGITTQIELLNWGIVSEIPAKKIMRPIYATLFGMAFIALVVIALIGSFGLWLARRRMLTPITDLSVSFQMAQAGNYSELGNPSSITEIKSLVEGYNRMIGDIRQRESELQNSELRYRGIVEDQTEFITRFLPDGTLTFVNDATCRYFKVDRENLLGKSFYPYVARKDREIIKKILGSLTEDNPISTHEQYSYTPNGEMLCQLWSNRAIFDDSGEITEIQSVGRDITKRKRAEEALQKSEASLKKAQEISHFGDWELDVQSYKATWSDEMYRLFGYEPGEITPKFITVLSAVHPDDKEMVENTYAGSLKTGESFDIEFRGVIKNGIERVLHTMCDVRVDDSGKPVYMHGTVHDVTERKRAEEKLQKSHETLEMRVKERTVELVNEITERKRAVESLKESEKQYRSLIETAGNAILFMAPDHSILEFNKEAERIYGYRRDEVIGKNYLELFLPKEARESAVADMENIFDSKNVRGFENQVVCRDGTKYTVLWNVTRVLDTDGKQSGVLAVGQDITEKKSLQDQLLHAEKLSSIGTFVSGVAHELNTPLSSILGYSRNLQNIKNMPLEAKEEVQIISEQSKRAASIVRNLLNFSRKQKPEKTSANINDIVESSLKIHTFSLNSDNIVVEKQLSENLAPVNVDSIELQQVFTNAILNAQDAMKNMPGKGTVTIKTEEEDGKIIAKFENTGPIIPEDQLKKIFDPFFTTKDVGEGTGLGLYVSYQIIKTHGGNMFVENIGKSGVRLSIVLPAAVSISEKLEPKAQPRILENIKILLVEDDPGFRRLLNKYLTNEGIFVKQATNGKEAVKLIEEANFDMILSDIKMPEMDGFEFCRWLKKNRPEYLAKFIFVTGVIDKEVEDFCAEYNCEYLIKPTEPKDILEKIKKIVA